MTDISDDDDDDGALPIHTDLLLQFIGAVHLRVCVSARAEEVQASSSRGLDNILFSL